MFSNYFASSVKTLVLLWMFGSLIKLGSLGSTTTVTVLSPCRDEADLVCNNVGSAEDHREALTSAFSESHKIDLVFIICNTTECTVVYSAVTNFIKSLVTLVSTKYESYIDTNRLHISVIVYDNTSVRVTMNDIEQATPTVGNCEFDKFLDDRVDSTEARGGRFDGLLTESLAKSKEVFVQSARQDAKKVLWLFSDCGYCESSDKRLGVETVVGDIKKGYGDNVVVFTVGITQCPIGWFGTLVQENTLKAVATTNSSHYACIDEWIKISSIEINSGNLPNRWSGIINSADAGVSCIDCANQTSIISHRCACDVSSKQYACHDFLATSLAIGIGVDFPLIIGLLSIYYIA